MKEQVLQTLRDLGFDTEEVGELGHRFSYEGVNFLFMNPEDDESFLSLSVPRIRDLSEVNDPNFFRFANYLNTQLKYTKAYWVEDSLWLFYERELLGEENMEELLTRMIHRLNYAFQYAYQAFEETYKKDADAEKSEDQ